MAEELAAGGIDAVGPAAEIDLVEIELEDLLLGEFPFERHRQHRLARLAIGGAVAVEEQVARQLLGDGRGAADPRPLAEHEFGHGAHQSHRINAEMRMEALVLHRDHGVLHRIRDFAGIEPVAEARPELDNLAPVARAHDDGLTGLGRLQFAKTGDRTRRKSDRDAEEDHPEQPQHHAGDNPALQPHAPARRRLPAATILAAAAGLAAHRRRIGPLRRRTAAAACPLVLQPVTPSGHALVFYPLWPVTNGRSAAPCIGEL